jgi:hypothetical protein
MLYFLKKFQVFIGENRKIVIDNETNIIPLSDDSTLQDLGDDGLTYFFKSISLAICQATEQLIHVIFMGLC